MIRPRDTYSRFTALLSALLMVVVLAVGVGRFHHHCCHGSVCFKWTAALSERTHHHNHVHDCNDSKDCSISSLDNLVPAERSDAGKWFGISSAVMSDRITLLESRSQVVSLWVSKNDHVDISFAFHEFSRRGPPRC